MIANLNTLIPLLGTEYCPDFTNKILLLEEMDAPFSREERSFTTLKLHGVFSKIQALIVGKPEKLNTEGSPLSYDELLVETIGPCTFPIISNFDCGHTSPMISFLQTEQLFLVAEQGNISIQEIFPE